MLKGKKILLGITASIAAYKAAFLIRLFVKEGAEVKVIITEASKDFVTPLTLATLSKNPVLSQFIEDIDEGVWSNHVELGLWADFILIAPATANSLSKLANGICDNLLVAAYLSAKCPVYIAPAMDLDMYKHGSTKQSLEKLISFGNKVIPPGSGELASGLEGEGRMAEPEEIIGFINRDLLANSPLKGKKVLINAGPTYEKIDQVRFIGNFSSGKMGVALAQKARALGATVSLVLGPTQVDFDLSGIKVIKVMSAEEMFTACQSEFEGSDLTILSAAVADYKPANQVEGKIKKTEHELNISLVKTVDILQTLGNSKKKGQIVVGFALESANEENYAKDKLVRKNADYIILNSLRDAGAGFGTDTNRVSIFGKDGFVKKTELLSKSEIASEIINTIIA